MGESRFLKMKLLHGKKGAKHMKSCRQHHQCIFDRKDVSTVSNETVTTVDSPVVSLNMYLRWCSPVADSEAIFHFAIFSEPGLQVARYRSQPRRTFRRIWWDTSAWWQWRHWGRLQDDTEPFSSIVQCIQKCDHSHGMHFRRQSHSAVTVLMSPQHVPHWGP